MRKFLIAIVAMLLLSTAAQAQFLLSIGSQRSFNRGFNPGFNSFNSFRSFNSFNSFNSGYSRSFSTFNSFNPGYSSFRSFNTYNSYAAPVQAFRAPIAVDVIVGYDAYGAPIIQRQFR
jgi:curved DNA-binding protein CbpA